MRSNYKPITQTRLVRYAQNNIDGFADQSPRDQRMLSHYLFTWWLGAKAFKHKVNPDYISIGYQQILSSFPGRNFMKMIKTVKLCDDIPYDPPYSSSRKGTTRGFKLTDEANDHMDDYLIQALSGQLERGIVVDAFTGNRIVNGKKSAIHSVDVIGNRVRDLKGKNNFKPVIKINMESIVSDIYKLIDYLDDLLNDRPVVFDGYWRKCETLVHKDSDQQKKLRNDYLRTRLMRLFTIYEYAMEQDDGFKLSTYYTDSVSGRLFANGPNLQGYPREIRKSAFKEMGYIDYDLENAHYSILYQVANKHGYHATEIMDYLDHKREKRELLAQDADISIDDAKAILISFIYGSSLSDYYEVDLVKNHGKEKASFIKNIQWLKNLQKQVRHCTDILIDTATVCNRKGKKHIKNARGKTIPKSARKSQKASHLMLGWESAFLSEAIDAYGEKMVLLAHDGFSTLGEIDTDYLSKRIKQKTGFNVQYSCTPF